MHKSIRSVVESALSGTAERSRATEVSDIARNYFNRGLKVESQGRAEEAIHWYDMAIAVSPGYFEVHVIRAARLYDLDRLSEALRDFDRAIACKPSDARMRASLHSSRGTTLCRMRRFLEAIEDYTRAIAIDPRSREFYLGRGYSRLKLENLSDGFEDFLIADEMHRPLALGPRDRWWNGHESLAGKTLLLEPGPSTGGIGDSFQFCRYAKLLADRGAKVILGVRPNLARLIRTLPGIGVVTTGDRAPTFDYQITMSRVLRILVPSVDEIYAPIGYLRANDALKAQWRDRLGDSKKPRVGIAWWTETPVTAGYQRSIPLRDLVAQLPPDFEYVSLQHQVRESDEAALRSSSIAHFGAEMTFDDVAAVMGSCDVVIAIDSSLAHLAGALGRPVWIVLPYLSDWRWFSDREDSPWYPTARLYRQKSEGSWTDVIEAISADASAELLND
jgi:hypothetical protein